MEIGVYNDRENLLIYDGPVTLARIDVSQRTLLTRFNGYELVPSPTYPIVVSMYTITKLDRYAPDHLVSKQFTDALHLHALENETYNIAIVVPHELLERATKYGYKVVGYSEKEDSYLAVRCLEGGIILQSELGLESL